MQIQSNSDTRPPPLRLRTEMVLSSNNVFRMEAEPALKDIVF